jgi:hypothetical protein
MQDLIRSILRFLMRLGIIRNLTEEIPSPPVSSTPVEIPSPITRKVLVIIHNPVLPSKENRTLREYFGWHDPNELIKGYIADLRDASYGYITYEVVEQVEANAFPVKKDGFCYDETTYLTAWETREFHKPDYVDYQAIVREFQIIEKVNAGTIDEVWLFGHPYGGYFESIMGGPGAFWCNSQPLAETQSATRRFVIMGFNFERGVGEMLESAGHRAESIMQKVYEKKKANLYQRFIRYEKSHPGQSECGNIHYAPNSEKDYDWGNARKVLSRSDSWYKFPDLSGEARLMDSEEWGKGEIRAHHVWWLRHLPHVTGETEGVSHNWWQYVIDPNKV